MKDIDLYGSYNTGKAYSAIDVKLVPCASRITLFDGSELGADQSCEWDQTKVQAYLGAYFDIIIYHNQAEFKQDAYGEDRIQRQIEKTLIHSVSNDAFWSEGYIQKHTLTDETDLI